ncbi:putative ABC transport system permease protein [Gemmobacter aquatilis]|uniref:Putative ABC transport system permease protein n=1 Tax=Gemmobacter aquatilis TaxID=933059 RepID=A0A1H8DTP4_9RHOB|nr:ABC transporter permease [Gemmobacter aquatilis]SEN10642.1 putative ABC transport system permease protein [Gemmobacter aquatilis]
MLWETIRLAVQAIRRNVMRSLLTVLGVVIGVAAVIAMVTVGQGSSAQVTAQVESLGTNLLILRPGKQSMGPGTREAAPAFRLTDVAAIKALPVVEVAAPVVSTSQTVVAGNLNVATTVTGTSADYLSLGGWTLRKGRAFTESEERGGSAVCLLGETVRQKIFGNTDPTGETLRVKNVSCTVIGLLGAKGASSFGQDQDDVVMMPVRAVQRRLAGSQDVNSVSIGLRNGVSTTRGVAEIESLMRERRRIAPGAEQDFQVTDLKQIAATLSGISTILTGMLSSVAAVSLLVGGIGIMNIMLVSVTERTREIGIRLSVGATSGQVLTQFLVEAVVLSLAGGVLGIVVGLALAALASGFMSIPFAPSPAVVALAFLFSAVVGVIFGYFPARRAARLDPIEALRHQ